MMNNRTKSRLKWGFGKFATNVKFAIIDQYRSRSLRRAIDRLYFSSEKRKMVKAWNCLCRYFSWKAIRKVKLHSLLKRYTDKSVHNTAIWFAFHLWKEYTNHSNMNDKMYPIREFDYENAVGNKFMLYARAFYRALCCARDCVGLMEAVASHLPPLAQESLCTLWLMTSDQQRIWSHEMGPAELGDRIELQYDKGLLGHALQVETVLHILDAYTNTRFDPEADLAVHPELKDSVLGTISANSSGERYINVNRVSEIQEELEIIVVPILGRRVETSLDIEAEKRGFFSTEEDVLGLIQVVKPRSSSLATNYFGPRHLVVLQLCSCLISLALMQASHATPFLGSSSVVWPLTMGSLERPTSPRRKLISKTHGSIFSNVAINPSQPLISHQRKTSELTTSTTEIDEDSGRGLDLKALETGDERYYEDISEIPDREKQLLIEKLQRELSDQYGQKYPMWNIVEKVMSTSLDLCQSNSKLRKQLRVNTKDKKDIEIKFRRLKQTLKTFHHDKRRKTESEAEEIIQKESKPILLQKIETDSVGENANDKIDSSEDELKNNSVQSEENAGKIINQKDNSQNQETSNMLSSSKSPLTSYSTSIKKKSKSKQRVTRSIHSSDSDSQHEEHLDILYRILSSTKEQVSRGYTDI